MPGKTVTMQVTALTDAANRKIAATGKYFDALRARNPVELTVKLNSAQALAEARILAREMSGVVSGKITVGAGGQGILSLLKGAFGGGGAPGGLAGAAGGAGQAGQAGAGVLPFLAANPAVGAGAAVAALAALPFIPQAAAAAITFGLGRGRCA